MPRCCKTEAFLGDVCPPLGKGSTKTMQPLPGLALVWVAKSRESSCSRVFKELQNALHHLSALRLPQVCEVCVCLPESYNYLWESNPWKHSRGKNPSWTCTVSSSSSRRSPGTEALPIHVPQTLRLVEVLGCLLSFLPSSAVRSSMCGECRGDGVAQSRKQPQHWES